MTDIALATADTPNLATNRNCARSPGFHEGEAQHGVEEGVHEVGQAEVHDEGVRGVPHAPMS